MNLFKYFKREKKFDDISDSYELEDDIQNVSNSHIVEGTKTNQLEFVDSSKLIFSSLPIQLA